jgi:hypothetical protein
MAFISTAVEAISGNVANLLGFRPPLAFIVTHAPAESIQLILWARNSAFITVID